MTPPCPPGNPPSISLRPLTVDDTQAAWGLSQALAWPHRTCDWQQLIGWANAHGVALAAQAGQALIGCGLAWRWGPSQASIGLLIVDEKWRRQGIGRQLFASLLQALSGCDVLLHATAQGRPLYEKSGFRTQGHAQQFNGIWQPHPDSTPASLGSPCPDGTAGQHVHPLQTQDIPALLAYDQCERGLNRGWLLQSLLQTLEDPAHGVICRTSDGTLCGYGLLRRFGRGWVIGPLLADSASAAMNMIRQLTVKHAGEFVRIDTAASIRAFPLATRAPAPDEVDALASWLLTQGLALVDQPCAMTRPATPVTLSVGLAPPQAQICILTSQALG
ncbi:MAG: GNAT family N-acetyltransferase [Lautropia sp.]|nr:GNAT family N-acetyltransferase [Lautropia sp.]